MSSFSYGKSCGRNPKFVMENYTSYAMEYYLPTAASVGSPPGKNEIELYTDQAVIRTCDKCLVAIAIIFLM